MNFCNSGGYLVGPDYWLPSEPADYFRASYGLGAVGCNSLVCSRCKQSVRHGVEGARRRYQCACSERDVLSFSHLDTSGESDPDPVPPWACAGHPSFVPPGVFAGVEVGSSFGWSPIVAAHIAEATNLHPAIDRIPGFALTRVFQALDSAVDQDALANAVGARGNDASLRARQGVALFFVLNISAPGLERVLDAWRADPARYDGHPAAFGPEEQLRSTLLEAIAVRIRRKIPVTEAALETWRWAALRGPGLGAHLHWASTIDPQWTGEHVEQLLDLAPADWESIVIAIHVEFPLRLVPGLRRAIAEGHATQAQVATSLTETYGAKAAPVVAALA